MEKCVRYEGLKIRCLHALICTSLIQAVVGCTSGVAYEHFILVHYRFKCWKWQCCIVTLDINATNSAVTVDEKTCYFTPQYCISLWLSASGTMAWYCTATTYVCLGKFLEHHRIFHYENGELMLTFQGSWEFGKLFSVDIWRDHDLCHDLRKAFSSWVLHFNSSDTTQNQFEVYLIGIMHEARLRIIWALQVGWLATSPVESKLRLLLKMNLFRRNYRWVSTCFQPQYLGFIAGSLWLNMVNAAYLTV